MSVWRCICAGEYRLNRGCDLCDLVMENDADFVETDDESETAHADADLSANSNREGK